MRDFNVVKACDHLKRSQFYELGRHIVTALNDAGYEAYFAGGAVRDALLERPIQDIDIATSARPEQVEKIFTDIVDIGRDFGVMGVKKGGHLFEVTTFRSDFDYQDGRRPTSVVYADLKTDSRRRDFTVNALYFDVKNLEIIDLVDGLSDLHKGVIRTVGDPIARFTEDHLRMLRALRFSAVLGFDIEPKTFRAIDELASKTAEIARERVTHEFERLLTADFAGRGLAAAHSTNILEFVLGFKFSDSEFHRAMKLVLLAEAELVPRLSALLYQRDVHNTLGLFRFSNQIVSSVQDLLARAALVLDKSSRLGARLKVFADDLGLKAFELAMNVTIVDHKSEKLLEELYCTYMRVVNSEGRLPEALVTSKDLLSQGHRPGPKFGQLLNESYLLQLEGRFTNKAAAMNWLNKQKQ